MARGLLNVILDNIFDESWKGKLGERYTESELKIVQLFGRKGKVLRNVYLPKDNGETSEVDVIFITQKGIFVFESKNYSGWIFGNENDRNWTVTLPGGQKNRFYNPIMQNKTHIKWMREFIGENIPLFSIIVFSERCELKQVTVYSDDIKVIKRNKTYAAVREIWERNEDLVSEAKQEELYLKLKELTNVDFATKKTHIQNIEKKYKQSKETSIKMIIDDSPYNDQKGSEENLRCPKCGNVLVLRTARKGQNAGKQFYGCSSFPKCRYIQEV